MEHKIRTSTFGQTDARFLEGTELDAQRRIRGIGNNGSVINNAGNVPCIDTKSYDRQIKGWYCRMKMYKEKIFGHMYFREV